jgi:cytochrome bd-type quinol oxidase subunit 2
MIALAPLWMIFFSGRRLKMSTDYAAVAAGAMAAILLIGVVEMHVLTSSASEMLQKRRSEWQEHLRELRQGESTSPPDNGLKHPLEVRAWGRAAFGFLWLIVSCFLCCMLVLVSTWAAVKGHGEASWLAWLSAYAICCGVATLLLGGWLKYARDLHDGANLFESIAVLSDPDPVEQARSEGRASSVGGGPTAGDSSSA